MALRIMKKIVIWSIQMKILERRDPKKNKNEEKLSLYLFLRSSYSAAEIHEKEICELFTTCYVSRKTQFQIPYFHTFFNQWDCFDETTITAKKTNR